MEREGKQTRVHTQHRTTVYSTVFLLLWLFTILHSVSLVQRWCVTSWTFPWLTEWWALLTQLYSNLQSWKSSVRCLQSLGGLCCSVICVTRYVGLFHSWNNMSWSTKVESFMYVRTVSKHSPNLVTWSLTWGPILVRSLMCARTVTKHFLDITAWRNTWGFTLERNHMFVRTVT